jgi:hypothetical protein
MSTQKTPLPRHRSLPAAVRWREASRAAQLTPEGDPFASRRTEPPPSSDGKTHGVGLSGVIASLVVAVPRVTRQVTGRFVCALGMICLRVCGGAGLAPAAGLIRSLSALPA